MFVHLRWRDGIDNEPDARSLGKYGENNQVKSRTVKRWTLDNFLLLSKSSPPPPNTHTGQFPFSSRTPYNIFTVLSERPLLLGSPLFCLRVTSSRDQGDWQHDPRAQGAWLCQPGCSYQWDTYPEHQGDQSTTVYTHIHVQCTWTWKRKREHWYKYYIYHWLRWKIVGDGSGCTYIVHCVKYMQEEYYNNISWTDQFW